MSRKAKPLEPPAHVTFDEWTRCKPWIEGALKYAHGTHTIGDVFEEIVANHATLWCWDRSALVTQIVDYPQIRVLNFWLAGGDLRDLLAHEAGVAAWGKANGCQRVSCIGRKGWLRVFHRMGYRPAHFITSREL